MLIGEIAAIARVSPRAIRHYHRVGILPEPVRASNDYRVYSVMDLTRLLRIRRLVGLGLPLHRIAETLRDEPEVLDSELEALESDLKAQMDLLHRQLAAVRSARASASPDSIALYDGNDEAFRDLWSIPGVRRIERDVGLLLATVGDAGLLDSLRDGLDDPARLAELSRLSHRFQAIDADSPSEDRMELVTELGRVFAKWADLEVRPEVSELVNSYLTQVFTPAQLEMISEAARRAEDRRTRPT